MSSYWRSSFALHSCCLGFRRCCLGVCRGMISHLFPHQNTTIRSLLLQGFQLPAMLCSGRGAQPGWAVSRLKAHWSTPKPLTSSEGPGRRGVQAGADAHAPTGTEGTASNGRCHPVTLRRTGVVVAADEVGSASCGDPGTHHQAWCPDPDHTHPCPGPVANRPTDRVGRRRDFLPELLKQAQLEDRDHSERSEAGNGIFPAPFDV